MNKLIYTKLKKELIIDGQAIDMFKYTGKIDAEGTAFQYLTNIEKQQVDGLSIEDFYLYDSIPLYFFYRPTVYRRLVGLIFSIMVIEKISQKLEGEFTVETDDFVMDKVCNEIFNIKCEKVSIETEVVSISKGKLFRRFAKGIGSYVKFVTKSSNTKKENLLVISHASDLNEVKGSNDSYFDTQLGSVIKELKSTYNILNFQQLNNKYIIDKTLKYNEDFVPFEIFIFYKRLKAKKLINNTLINDKLKYIDELNYDFKVLNLKDKVLNPKEKQLNLKDIMISYVIGDLKNNYISYLYETLVGEELIKKFKIKKCLVVGEGDRGRCIITAGNKQNIDTYAVQHGIINETSSTYIINSKYKDLFVPKNTFVWGKKYKNLLLEHTNVYNDNNVKVVGQARTDLLMQGNYCKISNNEDSFKILYATQYFKDLLEPATIMLFKSLSLMNGNYELVIKLHPADLQYEFYKEMIAKFNIKNCKIMKDGDLYDLIRWSDVVLSVHSTVVVEGAILNKPSICILLPKYNDLGGFVKEGLSYGVKDENELLNCMMKIKSEDGVVNNKLGSYIEENFYKVDGKVTERIVKTMINN